MSEPSFNPGQNLRAFSVQSASLRPPDVNAVYLRDGKYDPDDATSQASIEDSFKAFRSAPAGTRLALFFHGGLVDKANGSQGAANQYDRYQDVVFPLFFIWQSGIWELLGHHLPLILQETIFGQLRNITQDLVGPKLGVAPEAGTPGVSIMGFTSRPAAAEPVLSDEQRAALDVSIDDTDAFTRAVTTDPSIIAEVRKIVTTDAVADGALARSVQSLQTSDLLSEEVVAAMTAAARKPPAAAVSEQGFFDAGIVRAVGALAKFSLPIFLNTMKRFKTKRDHGFTCTIVEETLRAVYGASAGSSVWTEMKRETEAAFNGPASECGGTAVVGELVKLLAERPDLRVTLVGHSTGAIYIGYFLQAFDAAANGAALDFDVVLMAPACTFDFYQERCGTRVRALRMFGLSDAAESSDRLMAEDDPNHPNQWKNALGPVYPRSLLYFVSGVCETSEPERTDPPHDVDASDRPIFGMERFTALADVFTPAAYGSVELARADFKDKPDYARVYSPTPDGEPAGFTSRATKHGNFPGDDATIASVHLCFANGLGPRP